MTGACGHWWIDGWGDHRCTVFDDHTRHQCRCDASTANTPPRAPGVYVMADSDYHADLALSSSQARRLLEAPAKYLHDRMTGERHTDTFDFGKAAHAHVLGVGADIDVLEFDNWATKDAKAAKNESHAAGRIPILAKDWRTVVAMADAIRHHPIASQILNPERGTAELSMFWADPRTGAPLRSRPDWLPEPPEVGRLILSDFKTTPDASAHAFARSCATYGYHAQAAWYLDGVVNTLDVTDPAFLFIAQEKTAPYLVNVIELDAAALAIGRDRNRRAIDIWQQCKASGHWPAYSDDVQLISLPRWAQLAHDDDMAAWPDPTPAQF